MTAPTVHHAPIGNDGNIRPATTDEEARAQGLQKLVHKTSGDVLYRHSPDAREIVASGEYHWERW